MMTEKANEITVTEAVAYLGLIESLLRNQLRELKAKDDEIEQAKEQYDALYVDYVNRTRCE
jgi:hypothetical protein